MSRQILTLENKLQMSLLKHTITNVALIGENKTLEITLENNSKLIIVPKSGTAFPFNTFLLNSTARLDEDYNPEEDDE